ncbi:MAG: DUF4070 domain-containing protein [Gloeocapsa sp. DLM2.Bin57]|nr:MAG: DUF4070 domain-containing protein [Gloeocapsa sp. DLM2.Bin57]
MTANLNDLKKPKQTSEKPRYQPINYRKILCVFPKYSPSFGTFSNTYPLMWQVKAFMPPQGILVAASYLPQEWGIRFVDENIRPVKSSEYKWADVVIVSGMHIQRPQINQINAIAHRYDKLTVLGGPSVSSCPEYYPDFDLLQIGELGDAMDSMIAHIDLYPERPAQQIRFETQERLPLEEFPIPAYHLLNLDHYFIANIQYSSGCPYRCEFCDIPELYGRNPRLKKPEQIIAELDTILASGNVKAVYFVDDNFVGDRRAALKLLPYLIDWQKRNGYPVRFACEATLNLAQHQELLEMMREAYFHTVFCGIETPEQDALKSIAKQQNLMGGMSILEAIKTLNSYGLQVVSGIIMGLDTDTLDTPDRLLEFIRLSQIPMLTINLIHALPNTPLWRRLEAEGRLNFDPNRESNVEFLLPYEQVLQMWRKVITTAYQPDFLYERYAYNIEHTYSNRIKIPADTRKISQKDVIKGLWLISNLIIRIGIFSNYRQTFWKMVRSHLQLNQIENLIQVALVGHHLITFAQECAIGEQSASFYSHSQSVKAK